MTTVWVIMPTYDERECIATAVNEGRRALASCPPSVHGEVLVVDDASPDGTGDLADQLAREHENVRVLHRARKGGLAPAPDLTRRRPLGRHDPRSAGDRPHGRLGVDLADEQSTYALAMSRLLVLAWPGFDLPAGVSARRLPLAQWALPLIATGYFCCVRTAVGPPVRRAEVVRCRGQAGRSVWSLQRPGIARSRRSPLGHTQRLRSTLIPRRSTVGH